MLPNRVVIPHSKPTIGPEDIQAVADTIQSGRLAQGEKVRWFEEQVAGHLGRRGGVATNSGTSALHLALLALGVGVDDEIILPSYTCVALLHAIGYVGATPRLVDIEPDGYNLSACEVRRAVTEQTKAMIVPHMFGTSADVSSLAALGIPLIEDCAHALGGTYRGCPVGSVGCVTICSFYATKMITTGEGGMLLADSDLILRRARELRDYDERAVYETRFNYKMTEIQAALGLSQLSRLPAFVARRQALARRYTAALPAASMRPHAMKPELSQTFYRYVAGVVDAPRLSRLLTQRGIQCKPPVFRPLHRYLGQAGFPRTETAMKTALSIPLYPSLTDEDVNTIVCAVAEEVQREEERPRRALSSRS